MKRRTLLAALAGAPIASASLAACGTGTGEGPVTLEFWGWGATQKPLVEAWNAAHPEIQVVHTDAGGGDDSAAKLITTTRAGNSPDLALVEYPTLPSLIVAGVAADISDHVAGVEAEYGQGIWNQATFGGQTYGIPQDAGPQCFTYNRARLDELGIDLPSTWTEFADAAEQVKDADPTTRLATFAPAEFGAFAGLAQQSGATWWDGSGISWDVDIAGAESVAVAEFWGDLVDRDLVTAEPILTPEWNSKLIKGQVLSFPAGMWAPGVIAGVAADMAGDWAIAPLPQWTPGDADVAFQGGSAVVVTTDCEHPAEAAAFATWIGTAEEACRIQIREGNYPAATVGQEIALEGDPPDFMTDQEDYWEIAAQIAASTLPESTWGPNVNVASTAFEDAMSAAVTAGAPLTDALETVQEAVVADMQDDGYEVTGR